MGKPLVVLEGEQVVAALAQDRLDQGEHGRQLAALAELGVDVFGRQEQAAGGAPRRDGQQGRPPGLLAVEGDDAPAGGHAGGLPVGGLEEVGVDDLEDAVEGVVGGDAVDAEEVLEGVGALGAEVAHADKVAVAAEGGLGVGDVLDQGQQVEHLHGAFCERTPHYKRG